MDHERIVKTPAMLRGRVPNLRDYDAARADFSWEEVRALLGTQPDGGLNIGWQAVTRHALGERADHVALRWLGRDGQRQDHSYAELDRLSNRFANVLAGLGVGEGDRVYGLAGRVPELYVAALGVLKHQAVFCPLFSAFGPEPIHQRMEIGEGRVLVTTASLYRRKIRKIRDRLPALEHVLLIGDKADRYPDECHDLAALMAEASDAYEVGVTDPEDMALLHFTSGTTGRPKGAVHVHGAVVHHLHSARMALDLQPDDVFWCTADPGWVTGTSYGIVAPLLVGCTMLVVEAEFDPVGWYEVLAQERVTVWYTAPTAIRMLMRADTAITEQLDTSSLQLVASVGEPLNPEAVRWGMEVFGLPIHDNWWQTETGGILIANFAQSDIKPGSMGRPLPGIEAALARKTADGIELIDAVDEQGELAIKVGWPSMMRAYLHEEARYDKCFVGEWYLTGDVARVDADGYFWFVGRADDVINTAGHLVSPFEVESVLLEHEAVAEAGVIGVPDEILMERVKAFVALKPGFEASEELERDLHGLARKRLGAAVAPKEIAFREVLPKTRSGKIMRRLLKARELGLPEGDTSTLEEG